MARVSTPGSGLPTIRYSPGDLSFSVFGSGGGRVAALDASAPYASERFVAACCTRPDAVEHSDAGTFHSFAPAATSIARAAAPPWRIGSQWLGTATLPPANCSP